MVMAEGEPVGVYDFIKNICLNRIIDIDTEPCGDSVQHGVDDQREDRRADHYDHEKGKLFCLVACDDINQVLARNAADESHGRAEDAEEGIKDNGSLISGAVREYPFPVVQDLGKCAVPPAAK